MQDIDIDIDIEKDRGNDPNNRTDLKALLAACRDHDVSIRWSRLEELLDIETFITFMAMEMMLGHWDSYTLQHNNYLLFFDTRTGKKRSCHTAWTRCSVIPTPR